MTTAVGIGWLAQSASRITGKAASGFHLLRIESYSLTKTAPAGQNINSGDFSVGGHPWRVKYYPNGRDVSSASPHDYISLYLQMYGGGKYGMKKQHLQAQYKFSILDQAGNVAYGLPAKTDNFKSGSDEADREEQLCRGHERFIRREDLERREDLIKDDCFTLRCDFSGITVLETLPLASDNLSVVVDGGAMDEGDNEFGLKPTDPRHSHGHGGGRRRRRRADDKEFVQWCLAQKRQG